MCPRLAVGVATVLSIAATPALAQDGSENGPAERCESTDCFNQLQIRDLDVVAPRTLIVYVGARKCPFLVELRGTFCDLTYLGSFDVVFRPGRVARARSTPIVGGPGGRNGGGVEQTRVCAADINLGIEAGAFTSSLGSDDTSSDGLSCRISDVRSLTDDERIQIFVDNELTAPPPPFGTGRVEAPENPTEPEAQPADSADDAPPADETPRERRRRLRRERDAAEAAE